MESVTAACLVVKPWAGHRVGTTIVLDADKAKRFAALGVLEVIIPPKPAPPVEQQSDTAAAPMKRSRSRTNGA
jgi:hypothetical protein